MNDRAFIVYLLVVVALVAGLIWHLGTIGIWADLKAILAEIGEQL